MTDPQPTAATDALVDLVRVTCDDHFGRLTGELMALGDAEALVGALERRGVILLMADDVPTAGPLVEPSASTPSSAVLVHVHLGAVSPSELAEALRATLDATRAP